jgi:ABC-type lipoprotein release transport system permease subunit
MSVMTIAQARENFLAAMQTLRSSKVRSALTVLGIVIGVSSVISMASILGGLNKFVQDKVESLGSRTYFLTRLRTCPNASAPANTLNTTMRPAFAKRQRTSTW